MAVPLPLVAATAEDDNDIEGKEHVNKLVQSYVVCKLEEKLDVLYSFIKSHQKHKIMIFFQYLLTVQIRF